MLPSGILTCCTGPFWSSSLCLFGFCLPSLQCLISALTQAGGGDLLFRFASSVQPCCGEGGALQVSDRNWGLFAGWEGVASLRLSFPLSLPPASYLQWGYGAALLWSLSVPLFCEPPAVCSDRSIFLSLSHSLKNLPLTALRAFWPVPTLRNAAGSSPFRPLLLVGGCGRLGRINSLP